MEYFIEKQDLSLSPNKGTVLQKKGEVEVIPKYVCFTTFLSVAEATLESQIPKYVFFTTFLSVAEATNFAVAELPPFHIKAQVFRKLNFNLTFKWA